MPNGHQIVTLLVGCSLFAAVFFHRREMMDAIAQFRSGPRPPSHPLPGNDAFLVLRKRVTPGSDPLP